jgi:hypothetical protein
MRFAPASNVTEARRRTKIKLDSLSNQNRNLREFYTGAMVEISNLNPRRFLILLLVVVAPDDRWLRCSEFRAIRVAHRSKNLVDGADGLAP